jgi:hypothetical protein
MHESLMSPIRINIPNAPPKIIRKELIPDARAIVIIPIRAFRDKRLTAGQFRALGTLCSYANKAGLLWVGLERMGNDLGISKSAMCRYLQALERMGYIRTIYKGFKGERADTRQVIYNPKQSLSQTMKQTQTTAPFIEEQRQKAARKTTKQPKIQQQSTVDAQAVNESPMQDLHDVMVLKNKVSKQVWKLAVERAGTDTDYTLLKQTINKLLR